VLKEGRGESRSGDEDVFAPSTRGKTEGFERRASVTARGNGEDELVYFWGAGTTKGEGVNTRGFSIQTAPEAQGKKNREDVRGDVWNQTKTYQEMLLA